MDIHPKTVRLLTTWLDSTDELQTEVADFNSLYEPGVIDQPELMRNFPMLKVRRLILSHASSQDVLHVAQEVATGRFLAVVIGDAHDAKSVTQSGEMDNEQRYLR